MDVILAIAIGFIAPSTVPAESSDSLASVRRFCEISTIALPVDASDVTVHPPTRDTDPVDVRAKGVGRFWLDSDTAPVTNFSSYFSQRLEKSRPSREDRGTEPAFASNKEATSYLTTLARKLGVPSNWHIDPIEVLPDEYDEFDGLIRAGRYYLRFRKPTNHVLFNAVNNATISVDYITGQITSYALNDRIVVVESASRVSRELAVGQATAAYNASKKRGETILKSVDLGYYVPKQILWNTNRSHPLPAQLVWRVGFESPHASLESPHVEPDYTFVSATSGQVIEVNRCR